MNLKIIKEIDDKNLLQNVQNICIYAINNYKFNNHEDLRNIIQENLHKNLNGNWWVSVCDKLSSDYGNIDYKSVMIFQNRDYDYFIHIASIIL